MQKSRLLMYASVLAMIGATPALAQWHRVGTLDVMSDQYTDAQLNAVPTPVDRLRFRADSDVKCNRIRAVYDNGYSQELFSGTLFRDRDQTVYFPEGARRVDHVSLTCRSQDGDDARVAMYADDTGYHPAAVTIDNGDLAPLASRQFGYTARRSIMMNGRRVDSVAIEPIGADARCSRAAATYDDGRVNAVTPNNGDLLRAGRIYRLGIADRYRDLNSVDLTCRAAGSDNVTINVLAGT